MPFYFPFSLDFTHLFVEYLSCNRVSQSYKNPCTCLAEQQASVAQKSPPLSCVSDRAIEPFPSFAPLLEYDC